LFYRNNITRKSGLFYLIPRKITPGKDSSLKISQKKGKKARKMGLTPG
jgi:hypothetical protein